MAKTLYIFAGSVWAAVAELAVAELGYTDADIETKSVNLVQGENFAPAFLKLNPLGTLPTLEADGTVYTSTTAVVGALVKDAPTKVAAATAITETIHEDKYDPNFAMFAARNEAERAAKGNGIAGAFLAGRQGALEKYAADPEGAPFKAFYEAKLAQNGGGLAISNGTAPEEAKAGFFAMSTAHFAAIKAALYEILPGVLPASGFIGGATPGEDDFHVGAWLTRILLTCGAKSADDALAALAAAHGAPAPASVAAYWGAWTARPSWTKVYGSGLH